MMYTDMNVVNIKSYDREDKESEEYLRKLEFYSHTPTTVMAVCMQHSFKVSYSNNTSSHGIKGDYLVKDTNGHLYIITKQEFEKNWTKSVEATL